MKQELENRRLHEVCDFQNGFAFRSNLYKPIGLPIIRITNIQNETIDPDDLVFFNEDDYSENFSKYQVVNGDLIIAMSGATTGKIAVSKHDQIFYLNQRVGKFIPKKELFKGYLFYYLLSQVENNLRISAGAAQPNLSTEQIKNFNIPLPPLPEQHRIVAILDEAFAGIAKAKENAERNLKNAREVFDSYLNGLFAKKDFNWEEKKLEDLCQFVRGPFGGSLKKNIFKLSGYAVYEQQHAIYNQFNDIRYFIDEVKFNEMKRFELMPGDLIMSCSGTMGKTAIVPEGITRGIINQALLKLTPKKNILIKFLMYWMQSKNFQESLQLHSMGAAIQNVASVAVLKNIKLFIPPLSIQHYLVSEIESLSFETNRLEDVYNQKLANLDEIRKSVLSLAFSGELN